MSIQETSAERTLKMLGYTNCGGELWKPPLGSAHAQLEADLADARKDQARYQWIRSESNKPPLLMDLAIDDAICQAIDAAIKEQQ